MTRLCAFAAIALLGCSGSVIRETSRAGVGGTANGESSTGGSAGTDGPSSVGPGGAPSNAGGAGGRASHEMSGGANAGAGGDAAAGGPGEVVHTLLTRPTKPRGYLSVLQQLPESQVNGAYAIEAQFANDRGQWDGCTRNQLGDCWYYDCPAGSYPYRNITNDSLQNAGELTLTAHLGGAGRVVVGLLYDYWYQADGAGPLWPPAGGTLTFSATGGSTVPPFALSAKAPPTVWLESVNGTAAPTTITRSDGVKLTWTSVGTGKALFGLYGFTGTKFIAECEFDASTNSGELPAVLLQELEPSSDYYLTFYGVSRAQVSIGDWELNAALQGYGGETFPTLPAQVILR